MKTTDVLFWLKAEPFAPFRITMNSGRTYEVRRPELLRVLRGSFVLFTPADEPDVYDAEMVGLGTIERIEPLKAAAQPWWTTSANPLLKGKQP